MNRPKLYLPSNIKREAPNNATLTSAFKNTAIDLLRWLGIRKKNGDPTKFLNEQGDWVTAGGAGANLATSDLTQTDALRTYSLDGKGLVFNDATRNGGFAVTGTKEVFIESDDVEISSVNKVALNVQSGGQIGIATSAIADLTATNGQVLTLIDAVSGIVEYQNAVGTTVIDITMADFQDAVDDGTLTFPATYKLTDVQEGLFLESTSASTYNPLGVLEMYIPDYTITGVYMGQLESTDTVTATDRWIWGNQVWESITGVNSAAIDNQNLNLTDWNLLTKSTANGYILATFIVEFDSLGGVITSIRQAREQNSAIVPSLVTFQFGPALINNQWANSTLNYIQNTGIGSANNRIINGFMYNNNGITLVENEASNGGVIAQNSKLGGAGLFRRNIVSNGGQMVDNNLLSNGLFENNVVDGGKISAVYCQNSIIQGCTVSNDVDNSIGYGNQKDASEVTNCSMTGVACKIEAFLQNNNSKIIGLDFSGNNNTLTGTSQLLLDEITNITITGNDAFIGGVTQNGNCILNNVTISATGGTSITNIIQSKSTIEDITYSSSLGDAIENLEVNNCTLEGVSNIRLNDCLIDGFNLDLTGFTTDIKNLEIRGKQGKFSYSRDFSTDPLSAGTSANFGLIPNGAVATSLMYITDGLSGTVGATLSLGIAVDDSTYGFAPTAVGSLVSTPKLTFSNITTANRPMILGAAVGNVTGGKISVTVEFTIL